MLPQEAWKILEEAEMLCDSESVQKAIKRMAGDISALLRESNPIVLVIMRGGVFFAGQLLPLLRFPLELEYAHASRYGDATTGGALHWSVAPPASVRNRAVLVLDDILDAGETLRAVRAEVLALGAASCHLAVLTLKDTGRSKLVDADFVGLTLPNRYVFGCGLDVHGAWRNLPEIYALSGH
ncbi:MAG: hypoxanthine-guanine phosphoribosyltransferase [Betaproteobacteria bacterium RIFCSPLOWO2_02_FULL_62_17]|nr:MAG: hypoxanthine-guanine phosphoribosyltransferase [Betaproteobacteria bacterium RIFCSPLOWO2_02_FULL_62_17]